MWGEISETISPSFVKQLENLLESIDKRTVNNVVCSKPKPRTFVSHNIIPCKQICDETKVMNGDYYCYRTVMLLEKTRSVNEMKTDEHNNIPPELSIRPLQLQKKMSKSLYFEPGVPITIESNSKDVSVILRQSICMLAGQVGYTSASKSCLDILVDVVNQWLEVFSQTMKCNVDSDLSSSKLEVLNKSLKESGSGEISSLKDFFNCRVVNCYKNAMNDYKRAKVDSCRRKTRGGGGPVKLMPQDGPPDPGTTVHEDDQLFNQNDVFGLGHDILEVIGESLGNLDPSAFSAEPEALFSYDTDELAGKMA